MLLVEVVQFRSKGLLNLLDHIVPNSLAIVACFEDESIKKLFDSLELIRFHVIRETFDERLLNLRGYLIYT